MTGGRTVVFTVPGKAQPGGSKRWLPNHRVIDANPKAKLWQATVAGYALEQWTGGLMEGPLVLGVTFYVARPQGHYGQGRNSGTVRPSAPQWPTVRPDLTKLVRCLEDACTGVLWRDDAQVIRQVVRKSYGVPERTEVVVREL